MQATVRLVSAFIALCGLLSATPLTAQSAPVTPDSVPVLLGRVTHEGVGVPDASVSLHRITSAESGEIGQTVTDSSGAFRFPLQPLQGAAFTVFFVTADYKSVRFFGKPLHPDSAAAHEYILPVFDTTSVLSEPIRFSSRDVFMVADLLGGWEVLEILHILNPTSYAYVGREGMGPWEFRIPENATEFQVGEAEVMPHELGWADNRVLHLTPVVPGVREAFISYRLPPGPARAAIPIGEPTDSLNVFVREPSHLGSVSGLQTTRRLTVEGEDFLEYSGFDLQPGASVVIEWGRLDGPSVDPRVAAVVVTLVFLGLGIFAAIRNGSTRA